MGRIQQNNDYDVPVTTKCIPAAQGTKALIKDKNTGKEIIGPNIIAWAIGVRQSKKGDVWPCETWAEPITYNTEIKIIGVLHPDGTVDDEHGGQFNSTHDWLLWRTEEYGNPTSHNPNPSPLTHHP